MLAKLRLGWDGEVLLPYPSDQQRERALGVRKEQDLRRDSTYGEKEYYLPLQMVV
ncbi:MAG: hypothetical protein F6K39_26915 [Okeania sp. SIO3B3]|nr:hypothetical protein [Okeania sp. SIO3B3]